MILDYKALFETTLKPSFPLSIKPYSRDEHVISVALNEQRFFIVADKITAHQAQQYGLIFLQDMNSSTFLSGNADKLKQALLDARRQLTVVSPMAVCMPFEKVDMTERRFSYDDNGDVNTDFLTTGHNAFSLGSLFIMTLSDLSSWTKDTAFIPEKIQATIRDLIRQLLKQPLTLTQNAITIAEQLRYKSAIGTFRRRLLRVFSNIDPLSLASELEVSSNPTFKEDILDIAKNISATRLEFTNEKDNPFTILTRLFQQINKTHPNEAPSLVFNIFHSPFIIEHLLCIKSRRDIFLPVVTYINTALSIVPYLLKNLPLKYEPLLLPSIAYAHHSKWPEHAQQIANHYQQLLSRATLTITNDYEGVYLASLVKDFNLITQEQLLARFIFELNGLPSVLDYLLTTHSHAAAIKKIAQLKMHTPATIFEKLSKANMKNANKKNYFDTISMHMTEYYKTLSHQEKLQLYAKGNKIVNITLEKMISNVSMNEIKRHVFLQYQYEAKCLLRAYRISPLELLSFDMTEKLKIWCMSQLAKI